MCNLCSDDPKEREAERRKMHSQATRLRELATDMDAMADGYRKPHTQDGELLALKAQSAIRFLVEDYL